MSIQGVSLFNNNIKSQPMKSNKQQDLAVSNKLEKTPQNDSICFNGKKTPQDDGLKISCKEADGLRYDLEYSKPSIMRGNFRISGDEIELDIKNKLGGSRDIVGVVYGEDMNLNLSSGVFGVYSGKITGNIGNKNLDLKYRSNESVKSIELFGDVDSIDDDMMTVLTLLIKDKVKFDIKAEEAMMLIAIASA